MAAVKFAVIDVSDFLSKKQTAEPQLSADWAQLEELYNKKLWHQLTLKLQEFVTKPELQVGDNLIQLYNNFITTFENKINPLSLIEIVVHIIKQFQEKKDAIAFLQKMEQKVKINDVAVALCKVLQGQIYLEELNDLDATEKIISELENTLEDADGVTPVHGRYYKLASEYYRVRGPLSRYYRAMLRAIGCTGGADMSPAERHACALRLALAASLAPDVYDLGELLAHPILQSLEGTPEAWGCALVRAVAHGDAAALEAVRAKCAHVPELHAKGNQLRQKVAILCVMEMAFNRPSSQRKLTFAEIAAEAKVPLDEVELLVMKALAEKLIRGHIDQVQGTVHIQWVKARALSRDGCSLLAERLTTWCRHAHAAADTLSNNAADVLTL